MSQNNKTGFIKTTFIKIFQFLKAIMFPIIILGISLYIGLNFNLIRISGVSMNPTYQNNDLVLSYKNTDNIQKGDIVVIDSSRFLKEDLIIKRVIATGGDTISVKQGKVTLNGKTLNESYINQPKTELDDAYDVPKTTVPKGKVFVLGDNRPFSLDSRAFGMVNISDIKSVVIYDGSPIRSFGQLLFD